MPPAWAFDVFSLVQAQRLGAVDVELFDTDTCETYGLPIADVYERGFKINRGHGEQVAVPLNCWQVRL
jgi:hypothetical protein